MSDAVRDAIRAYYAGSRGAVVVPNLDQREFGFGNLDKIDYRHKAFPSQREFDDFMSREGPLYSSFSTAKYSLPAARPMPAKGSLGVDLVFDLDRGYSDEHKERHNAVICRHCLERAREDALRFFDDFLVADFGFSRDEVEVNFSGNKGFHFHVRTQAVQGLSPMARKELCDYATAFNVSAATILHGEEGRGTLYGPSAQSRGWEGKAYRYATGFITSATEEDLANHGLRKAKISEVTTARAVLLRKMAEGNWDYLKGLYKFWAAIIDECVKKQRVETDAPVTFDLGRLIRIPNTIHGSTGLLAKKIKYDELSSFSPLEDAVALKEGEMTVEVKESEQVELANQTFLVQKGERPELPTAVAVLLIRKGIAAPPA